MRQNFNTFWLISSRLAGRARRCSASVRAVRRAAGPSSAPRRSEFRNWAVILCICVAPLLVAAPAQAAGQHGELQGAQPLDQDERALFAAVGVPDIRLGLGYGLTSLVDIAPQIRLAYGQATRLGSFGAGVGCGYRFRFATLDGWHFALVGRPEITAMGGVTDFPPSPGGTTKVFGLDLGVPGLVASQEILPKTWVSFSLRVPVSWYLLPSSAVAVPVLLGFGGELGIGDHWRFTAKIEGGSVMYYGKNQSSELSAAAWVGLGWL